MSDWQWFRGEYATWDAARSASRGYDDPAILERVLQATLRVVRGEAEFERDGVAFALPFENAPLARALRAATALRDRRLRVLDFGGSLGSAFWQHRETLAALREVDWRIVEQPHFVAAGRRAVADARLRFFDDLASAASERPDLVLVSSSLQYVAAPWRTLDELLALGAPWFFLDRTPLLSGDDDRLTVEEVPPELGATSYPAWFLSEERLLRAVSARYEIGERFVTVLENGAPESWRVFGREVPNRGFVLRARPTRTEPRSTSVPGDPPGALSVAVVTPSFNQARFLRQAIDSVLAQDTPAIDYLVVDGGSTDGSLDVLRSCGDRVRWISEPDRGQADAIAKGFARTTGDVLAWINSDDALAPGAVARALEVFRRRPEVGLVYGNGDLLDEGGRVTGPFPWTEPFDLWRLIYFSDYILQPAAFFRRSAYEAAGGLDTSLHWAMDWDLWIRLAAVAEVCYLPETLGCSRVWSDTKTATGGWRRIGELTRVARRWTGRRWTTAVQRYALDTLAQQLRRWLPRGAYRPADFVGRRVDARILRRMPAQEDGWLGPRGHLVFPRRWRRARLVLEIARRPPAGRGTLRLALDGRSVVTRTIEGPGEVVFELEAAPAADPFCRVDLRCDFAFPDTAGRERFAARRRSLEPA